MLCLNCNRRVAAKYKRGLCRPCYLDLRVRERYPCTSKYGPNKNDAPGERNRKPERKPGDPLHRCLWCLRWRCDAPMRLCEGCQGEYEWRAAGMPQEGHRDSRALEPSLNGCSESG